MSFTILVTVKTTMQPQMMIFSMKCVYYVTIRICDCAFLALHPLHALILSILYLIFIIKIAMCFVVYNLHLLLLLLLLLLLRLRVYHSCLSHEATLLFDLSMIKIIRLA